MSASLSGEVINEKRMRGVRQQTNRQITTKVHISIALWRWAYQSARTILVVCIARSLGSSVLLFMAAARIFLTHIWCPSIEAEFDSIASAGNADTWLLLDSHLSNASDIASRYATCHIFNQKVLRELPYSTIPTVGLIGHGHFPLLDFFLHYPSYDFYWFIEYDVRYTGLWAEFFDRYDSTNQDFITAHIRHFIEEPLWPWWPTLGHRRFRLPPPRSWVRSFNVIYRISRRALIFLDTVLRCGWHGHHEVLIATLLYQNGFGLLDFGGHGGFVNPLSINSAYSSSGSRSGYLSLLGTMRYRPARATAGQQPNMLYHPVKPPQLLSSLGERRAVYKRWQTELQYEMTARQSNYYNGLHITAPDLVSHYI